MKVLIDEDLSPTLVGVCHAHGIDATCVRDRGMLGRPDADVFALCQAEDRTLVTNNTKDFVHACETAGLHAGLISIPDQLTRAEQASMLASVLDEIRSRGSGAVDAMASFMTNTHVTMNEFHAVVAMDLPR